MDDRERLHYLAAVERFRAELRELIPRTLERGADGRYHATEDGRRVLNRWLRSKGATGISVAIVNGRYEVIGAPGGPRGTQ